MNTNVVNGTESLDEIERAITDLKREIGDDEKKLADKKFHVKRLEQQLVSLMGDARKIETAEWKYTLKVPNPAKKSWYTINQVGTAEQKQKRLADLKANLPSLVMTEIKDKINIDQIKQQLAEGKLFLTESGKLITSNGEIVAGIIGQLKPASVTATAKKEAHS